MNDELLGLAVIWLIGCTVVAWIASSQGRSPLAWFGISVLLSPLLGFLAVVLTPKPKEATPQVAAPPCPRCGTPRTKGQRHCTECGLDLWADYDAKRATR